METIIHTQEQQADQNCQQKKIFVFDLHDVLFSRHYRNILKLLFSMKNKLSFFFVLLNPFFIVDALKMLFITRVSEAYLIKLSQRHARLQPYVESIIDVTNALQPIPEMFSLVEHLKRAGHKVYIFSNIGQQTYEKLTHHYHAFFQHFDGIHYAQDHNNWLAKPHQNAYRLFLEKFTIDPTTMVFVDDKHKNVVSAQHLGITAIQYRSPHQLLKHLRKNNFIE